MVLEMQEMRQFYVEKAEEHPLLQEMVAGTKTFTGVLAEITPGS